VLNSTDTEGTINITIADTTLSVPETSKPYFSSFSTVYTKSSRPRAADAHFRVTDAELTDLDFEHFQLEGHARAIANLSLGTLTLDPIKFNVSSGLWGLRGLKGLVSIDGVDVLGGTEEAMSLAINVTIDNPSNLNLGLGDLGTYSLCLYLYAVSVITGCSVPTARGKRAAWDDHHAEFDSPHRWQLNCRNKLLLCKAHFTLSLASVTPDSPNLPRSPTTVPRVNRF